MSSKCRIAGCKGQVYPVLSEREVCLEHFLDAAFDHAGAAQAAADKSLPVDRRTLECLLDEAHLAAQFLTGPGESVDMSARERLLEFLLHVANLHEYAARFPSRDLGVN